MRARKLLATSVVLATAVLGIAACGDDDSGDGSGGKVTMSFWHNATTGDGKAFWEKTVADFQAANPNVKIEIQSIQNEDMDGKLQTALNSGDAPDVFLQRGGGKMAAMVKAGQLMDITGSITEATKKVISAGSFKAQTIDNKVYAMPVAVLPGGFFYSKDQFAKAGIAQTPTTLAELRSAVDKLKTAGVQPIALGAKDAWPAAFYYYFFALRECSPATLSETAKTLAFDNACWLKAGQDVQDFAATKPFNNDFLTTSAQQGAGSSAGLLANHKAAMELMGAWNPGVIASLTPDQKPLPDLDWFPFPSIEGGAGEPGSILGGVDGYSCSVKAPKAECTAFLNYIAKTDVQSAYYKAFNAPPVNSEAQAMVSEPYLKSVLAAYSKAPYVSQWLDTVYGQNVGNALNTAVVNLLAGKGTAQDIVNAVKTAAKRA
ncbi:sugar ABC transporter substrate-binding protein [Rhizocola hellebori]|uniref:Sugar ABC transporter substrate-binding protein n=1 Tax=Rhizocola hellebori TaxID=1392758 RepID=A0A8J3Q393_9ACTN|nr:extracellular solute-binding protein [Rhizocola hellebori]GIH03045.1 sugar ABC transporter substrate-binding protein [Rhizocola hellebori]